MFITDIHICLPTVGGCDDLKFENKFEVPVIYSTAIPGSCCDIYNVVGNQFHRHYNTVIQIQWS
jgi:hypothetical protein